MTLISISMITLSIALLILSVKVIKVEKHINIIGQCFKAMIIEKELKKRNDKEGK
jgi:hypothetical protein